MVIPSKDNIPVEPDNALSKSDVTNEEATVERKPSRQPASQSTSEGESVKGFSDLVMDSSLNKYANALSSAKKQSAGSPLDLVARQHEGKQQGAMPSQTPFHEIKPHSPQAPTPAEAARGAFTAPVHHEAAHVVQQGQKKNKDEQQVGAAPLTQDDDTVVISVDKDAPSLAAAPAVQESPLSVAPVQTANPVPISQEISQVVEQLAEQIMVGHNRGTTETMVNIRYPGLFNGATVTLVETDTARGVFNIRFANLSPEARIFLDSINVRQNLMETLTSSGVQIHLISSTEKPEEMMSHFEESRMLSADQEQQEQQEQQEEEQQEPPLFE